MIGTQHQKPVIVFIHIPKTGGTTLFSTISNRFTNYAYINGYNINDFSALEKFLTSSQKERNKFDFLRGHMPYGIHQIMLRPCRYITLLRHPLEQRISHYHYSKIEKLSPYYELIKNKKMNIEEFFDFCDSNILSRRILGFDVLDKKWDWRNLIEIKKLTRESYSEICSKINKNEITPDMMKKAKSRIRDDFFLAGITERMSDFMFLLCKKLDTAFIYQKKGNLKISSQKLQKRQIDPDTIKRFLEKNSMDMELYNYTADLFEEKMSKLSTVNKLELHYYKLKEFAYKRIYKARQRRFLKI